MECSGRRTIRVNGMTSASFNPSFSMECSGRYLLRSLYFNLTSFNPSFSMECSGRFADNNASGSSEVFQSQFFNGMLWNQALIYVVLIAALFQSQFFNGMLWKLDWFFVEIATTSSFNPSFSMEWSGTTIPSSSTGIGIRFQSQFFNGMVWKSNYSPQPPKGELVSILVFRWNALEAQFSKENQQGWGDFNPSFSMECSGRLQISLFLLLGFHFNPSCLMECSGSAQSETHSEQDEKFQSQFFNGMVWKIYLFRLVQLKSKFQSQFFNGMVWKFPQCSLRVQGKAGFNPSFSMECSGSVLGILFLLWPKMVSILVFQWNALEEN